MVRILEASTPAAAAAIQRSMVESSLSGERVLSIARLVFCAAVVVRSAFYWALSDADRVLERAWISYPTVLLVVLFSLAVLRARGRHRSPSLVIHLSVALDLVVTFAHLLPNSLWPGPGFLGAPFLIDTAVILVVTVAAGLRQSVTAAALGGGLSGLALVGLAIADMTSGVARPIDLARGYTMYAVLVGAVTSLSLLITLRNRRLIETAARAAVAAESAGRGLRSVLRDHHDLRTVISSAQINADLLARGLGSGRVAGDAPAGTVAHLLEDLSEIRQQLEQLKGRTLEELAALEERQPATVGRSIADVVSALAARFPRVAFQASSVDLVSSALVAGGGPGLRRILANLTVNACEGDGSRGASRVELRARVSEARVIIEILDDGPGLPEHIVAGVAGEAPSSKPAGAGLGIGLVAGLVRASGGRIAWSNRPKGGAWVVVDLPAAPESNAIGAAPAAPH
jgi:signal transduction histidine kinase